MNAKGLKELGERAVACKHWGWMPGMRCTLGEKGEVRFTRFCLDEKMYEWGEAVLDLNDPATKGCLLELVRKAFPLHHAVDVSSVVCQESLNTFWYVHIVSLEGNRLELSGRSEAEVLVLALELAGKIFRDAGAGKRNQNE